MTLKHLLRHLTVTAVLWCAGAQAAEESVLMVEQVAGLAAVQRDGKRLPLQPGDALQEQDLIVTEDGGRATLRFARHGFMDIGPNAEIGVERLPFAAYAKDLKSVFSVSKGYLRVVWKHPQQSTNWPLYVYMAGHRISLVSGEYFFLRNANEQRICVAAGQLALQAMGGDAVETIKPPSCTKLVAGIPPQTTPRNPDDWIVVRRSYDLHSGASLLAVGDATPPPVVPRALIATAALPPGPSSAPTAIAAPIPVAVAKAPVPTTRAPAGLEALSEDPGVRTSTAASRPVAPAPVLPTPAAAPRTTVIDVASVPPAPIYAPPVNVAVPPLRPSAAPAPIFTPARPPAPTTSLPSGGSWSLNIASYTDSASAEKQAEQLRAAGYRVQVQPAQVNGRTWHRVQVPGYASQQQAREAAGEIKGKLGLQGIWVVKSS